MKKGYLIRFNTVIVMLAFSAGLIFFACGFSIRLPKNITVNGTDIGGKTRAEALRVLRGNIENELKQKSITVIGKQNKYVFSYPEIGYKDNLQNLLKTVRKNGVYTADVSYYLNGLNEIAAMICADESAPMVEPYAVFNTDGEPFTYYEGSDGKTADYSGLLRDVRASLGADFNDVYVDVKTVKRTLSMNSVKYNTRLLSTFTTRYDGSNAPRAHNTRLASEKINGTVLCNGESFSFNETVGQRTVERGFKSAKIIERGEFVDGVGGGVCQVSTTLFNAALLSGCDMTEFHQHSLAVSYVPPSFDAMVSGTYFDLKFENRTGYTLYIRAVTGRDYVTFNIYGRGDGASYGYSSVVKNNIPAPEEITEDESLVKEGRDGTVSEGYLTVTRNGVSVTKLFRRDKYAPLKRVVLKADGEEETGDTGEAGEI